MKELQFLEIINKTLDDNSFLGNDCAFLDDLGIYITHDTLVEDIHFSLYTTNAYNLGRKAVSVNLSDLAAALSIPQYITVSVSMPKLTKNSFIEELYKGINDICREYNIKVIGGDITGSEKIVISICAIGKKSTENIISRSNAKKDDYILVTGDFGASAAGFHALSNFLYADNELINRHINPIPKLKEAEELAKITNKNITVMDCSDGLVDALYKISKASMHSIKIDINDVPVHQKTKDFCEQNQLDYKQFVKWGGEDFELLICVPEEIYNNLDENTFKLIGTVQNKDNNPCVLIQDEDKIEKITKTLFEEKSFNHFNCK